MQKENRSRW